MKTSRDTHSKRFQRSDVQISRAAFITVLSERFSVGIPYSRTKFCTFSRYSAPRMRSTVLMANSVQTESRISPRIADGTGAVRQAASCSLSFVGGATAVIVDIKIFELDGVNVRDVLDTVNFITRELHNLSFPLPFRAAVVTFSSKLLL